jgi:hypothetical protein
LDTVLDLFKGVLIWMHFNYLNLCGPVVYAIDTLRSPSEFPGHRNWAIYVGYASFWPTRTRCCPGWAIIYSMTSLAGVAHSQSVIRWEKELS